ncbi:aminotransferase class IV [Naasia sp. SYSU D00948]|uniref:aminotransferase class IV n=1 Tax=Naasia sp. SYSU D00948 TaxID=2817379 RepID=UPI001B306438|nr:aminotransferase class IV [Naasia sp. SYSU D00948]
MAADPERILRWRDGRLTPAPPGSSRLLVADSFLLADGAVVALDRHRDRFLSSVRDPAVAALAGGPPAGDEEAFWTAAVGALPRAAAWFPRLELADAGGGPELRLRLRPAPRLATTVTVATWTGADPRRVPHVKGPDLEALLAVRAAVVQQGAGDAVLVAPDGAVCDGATSAIAWWEDNVLCFPPAELPRVDSVTARCLAALAHEAAVPVRHRSRRPEELAGREVWMLSALHGIRRVEQWIGGPGLPPDAGRLEPWRSRLEFLRRPVDAGSAGD